MVDKGISFDESDLKELARRAAQLSSDTSEVPRLLRVRLGPDHALTKLADEMLDSLETFTRDLRSFRAFNADSRTESTSDT